MSNEDLKSTDYSNTIVVQSEDKDAIISIFPLVTNVQPTVDRTEQVTATVTTTAPTVASTTISTNTGGSSY